MGLGGGGGVAGCPVFRGKYRGGKPGGGFPAGGPVKLRRRRKPPVNWACQSLRSASFSLSPFIRWKVTRRVQRRKSLFERSVAIKNSAAWKYPENAADGSRFQFRLCPGGLQTLALLFLELGLKSSEDSLVRSAFR